MSDLKWGEATQGWRLSISLDKNFVPWSEPIFLTIVLRNVSDRAQELHNTSRWAYDLRLEDEDGVVPLTRYGVATRSAAAEASAIPAELEPGETLVREVPVSRMFDISLGGDYRLRASRVIRDPATGREVQVTSNQVSFQIDEG